tara:strand:- start:933 stop:1802 length:870 start_codon:yes stop_codon:yes gene_type:complete
LPRRNNEDRVGAKHTAATEPPTTPAMDQNAGAVAPLSFVVPTEFVELPSRGLYYPEDHPLHMQEHIEIRHMTAKDEDILTSRTLLKKGVALDRFLQNIVVDKRVKLDSILIGDKNAMLISARISGYGNMYKTQLACTACGEKQEDEFDLFDANVYHGTETDDFDVVRTDHGTFIVTLPKTQVQVEVRLLMGRDEQQIVNSSQQLKKNKKPEKNATSQFRWTILSANGDKTKRSIEYLIDNMPASDARYLRKAYKAINPTVDLKQEFECEECGYQTQLEVPFTTEFFWPK